MSDAAPGATLLQGSVLAKNCRTSVEMIQKFYAAHIKDLLDASAINVMRPKRPKKPPSGLSDKDLR